MRTYSRTLRIITTTTLFFFAWSFLPLWQAVAYAAAPEARKSGTKQDLVASSKGQGRPEERFEKALDGIRENVVKAREKEDRGEDDTRERDAIRAKRAEIESADGEFKKEFSATEKKLKDAKLPKEILERHAKFIKHYEDNLKELRANLDDIDTLKADSRQRKAAFTKAKAHLEKIPARKSHKPFDPTRLPSRTREIKPVRISWVDKAMDWLVPSAEAAENPPTSADLAETLETPQTQEIRDLAQQLGGTSVSLYEYVRNAFIYEPYAASTKGAVQTLREKSGNEWDLASTLISLYRASGIPARYVVGTVEIPIDTAMNWLGVEDPIMAGTLMLTLGRTTGLVYSGGKVTALRTQHVWVRAYVPFLYSRGATTGTGDMWVDVDPSFKGQTITKTLTVTGAPAFDQSAYLSTFRTESPFEFYRSQLQGFLDANNPGYVPEALALESEITPERFGVLIGQPPYIIKSVTGTYSEIPDSYRQKFTLSITDPSTGNSLLYYTAPMPQIIGKRMTLSYIPATTADETTIASYGGIFSTPPYLVNLKPEIKIDGVSAIQGNEIGSGQEQNMEFIFDTTIDQGRVENIIIAGGYYAIGLSARSGDTRENILERTNQLAAVAGTIDFNDPATLDQKLGEILYLSATVYHQNLDAITKKIASLDHVVDVRDVSEMMYFLTLKVDTVFGMPRSITPAGITGDMDRNLHTIVPFDGDMSRIKPFMQLQGTESSFLEHDVTEKIYQTQALSTVKGIQLAHDQGIPVHTINGLNIVTELSTLQLSQELKADIANAVNAGQEVIVPERNLTLGNWTGVGYIIQDPSSGRGAYLISGGYGGIVTILISLVEDLFRSDTSEIALAICHAVSARIITFPGKDNFMHTADDVLYTVVNYSEIQEDCGDDDGDCSKKYAYNNPGYYQPLIKFDQNGANTYLTKNITAQDWQCQSNDTYMRAGTSILFTIEWLMYHYFTEKNVKGKHNLRPTGSGYRTKARTETLLRGSKTSHHPDGVASDVWLTSDNTSVAPTPSKSDVLFYAFNLISGKGEIQHEGTINTVHMAIPGKQNYDFQNWVCQNPLNLNHGLGGWSCQ